MKTNKTHIEDLKKKAKDLEEILMGVNTGGIDSIAGEDVLPKLKAISPLDYDRLKNDCDRKASDVVESVILLYLPHEFVSSQDYVYQKMEVDKLTVSNLLFQMKTAEHAIKKCMEEIDAGSTRDRTFEVLSSLQRSKMEIIKHLQAFMVTMENNYKQLKFDWSNHVEKSPEITGNDYTEVKAIEEDSMNKFRGTKTLMNLIQSHIEEAKNKKHDGNSKENASGAE